jgi:hypothetical protein
MSDQGSGSGGQHRSSRLAKGKAVAYASESPPDTDDDYNAMEDPRTRADRVITENLQRRFDAEADDTATGEVRPPPGAGITIGGNTRSSGAPRRSSRMPAGTLPVRPLSKRPRAAQAPPSASPISKDFVMPGVRYPPQGQYKTSAHGLYSDTRYAAPDEPYRPSVDLGPSL